MHDARTAASKAWTSSGATSPAQLDAPVDDGHLARPSSRTTPRGTSSPTTNHDPLRLTTSTSRSGSRTATNAECQVWALARRHTTRSSNLQAPPNIQCVRTSSVRVRTTMWFAKSPWTSKEVPDGNGMWVGFASTADHVRCARGRVGRRPAGQIAVKPATQPGPVGLPDPTPPLLANATEPPGRGLHWLALCGGGDRSNPAASNDSIRQICGSGQHDRISAGSRSFADLPWRHALALTVRDPRRAVLVHHRSCRRDRAARDRRNRRRCTRRRHRRTVCPCHPCSPNTTYGLGIGHVAPGVAAPTARCDAPRTSAERQIWRAPRRGEATVARWQK